VKIASQTGSKRFCSNCGAPIGYDERFCPNCGVAITAQPQQQPQYPSTATSGPTPYAPSQAAPTIGMINCPTCGASIRADSYCCKTCNTVLQRPGYIPPSAARADSVSAGLVILSVFIPLAGIILGIVRLSQGRQKEAAVYGGIGLAILVINIVSVFFSGWFYF
jgi:predicted nucleic acid-binding Zn ribbon protein